MKANRVVYVILLMFGSFIVSKPAAAAEWRFPIGISYVPGIGDVADAIEENAFVEVTEIPVGLSLQAYAEFDNGIGIGGRVGPVVYGYGDLGFYIIPLGLDFRYVFLKDASISPFVRIGGSFLIEGGDLMEGSSPGVSGGIGLELFRDKTVGIGLELSYDSSEVEIGNGASSVDTKPYEFMLSLFVVF